MRGLLWTSNQSTTTKLVDSIRVLEQRYQAQLEQARESVRLLSRSVTVLRNRRLELEMVEMSDA
jgi:phosphoenolpyruvate carboxylase